MSEKLEQDLSGIAETLLITLWLKVMESQRADAAIQDEKTVALVKQAYDHGGIWQRGCSEVKAIK